MMNDKELSVSVLSSYWKVFRVIFVVFSLYVMGLAFYSWDGFKYYGSFPDFLIGVAILSIIWSIVAVILPIVMWPPFKLVEWGFLRMGWKIRIEHMLMGMSFYIFGSLLFEKLIMRLIKYTRYNELIIFIAFVFISILLTILIRKKSESWISIIQERVTPLVWLFGIILAISIPLVAYQIVTIYSIGKKDKVMSRGMNETSFTNKEKPNIILVTFDALAARDMSAYGYHRETTPFITEWAKNATIFSMTESSSNYTTPSTASLMTGKRVWTHQVQQPEAYKIVNNNTENLPILLKKAGYHTIALTQNGYASATTLGISDSIDIDPLVSSFMEPRTLTSIYLKLLNLLFSNKDHMYGWIFNQGIFQKFLRIIPQRAFVTEYPPEKVFNKFLEIVDSNPPEPFFAWVHIFPPHAPFLPSEPYIGMYDSSPKLRTVGSQIWGIYYPENVDIARARYDEFMRYCDDKFKNFIRELNKRRMDNTIIILSADHGESFEHNYITHGDIHLYEAVTHIPLIIREPDQTGERIINDLAEQIDIAPTILDLAGISTPSWMEGRSLIPLMRGRERLSKPALSMVLESTPKGELILEGTFAVWEGDFKLIYYLKDNKSLLFNIKQDPAELNNLVDREPEIAQRLLTYIKTNLKKANEKIGKVQYIAP